MCRWRTPWLGSSVSVRVKRLRTPNCASMRFIHEAGGREDRRDAQAGQPAQEARVIVDVVEVIQDDDQPPPRVAPAQPTEGGEQIGDALAAAEDAAQAVAVDVVEAEEVAHSLEPAVGRPHPPWCARRRPGGPAEGL